MNQTKKKRVLLLFDMPSQPPQRQEAYLELMKQKDWMDERHIYKALKKLGKYEVSLQGISTSITPLIKRLESFHPDVVFSLAESFMGEREHAPHLVSLLELFQTKYTGPSAAVLSLCRDKGLSKKILSYHGIKVPRFLVLSEAKDKDFDDFCYPAIIKPLDLEASEGITMSSVVYTKEAALKQIEQLQKNYTADIIIEEFIPGRDIYLSLLGGKKLKTLPIRELCFTKAQNAKMRFATYKAKWDDPYRKKWGIKSQPARGIDEKTQKDMEDMCKRIYRLFGLKGCARMDLRWRDDGEVYFIEANPNPALNKRDELALSAKKEGISYEDLIDSIIESA